jgi:hypothetical protein
MAGFCGRGHQFSFLKPEENVTVRPPSDQSILTILCACGLLAMTGCASLKLVPVSGTVTQAGKPLTGGAVSFVPDASKGNNARLSCLGRIGPNGRYELLTNGVTKSETGKGAPIGWYKVALITTLPGAAEITVNPIYTDPETTPLLIEVVANPEAGRYDLKLDK